MEYQQEKLRLSEIDISKAKDLDEAIINEINENKEISTIEKDMQDLYDIIYEIRRLVQIDGENLENATDNISEANMNTVEGTKELQEAKRLYSYKPIAFGASIGTLIGGPIGLGLGLGYGAIITAIGTGTLGGVIGKYLSNKK